jgi:hypothetical protein
LIGLPHALRSPTSRKLRTPPKLQPHARTS